MNAAKPDKALGLYENGMTCFVKKESKWRPERLEQ